VPPFPNLRRETWDSVIPHRRQQAMEAKEAWSRLFRDVESLSWKEAACCFGSAARTLRMRGPGQTRRSFACMGSDISPISSRNSVPPSAASILPILV
jgi:hypothetical protein